MDGLEKELKTSSFDPQKGIAIGTTFHSARGMLWANVARVADSPPDDVSSAFELVKKDCFDTAHWLRVVAIRPRFDLRVISAPPLARIKYWKEGSTPVEFAQETTAVIQHLDYAIWHVLVELLGYKPQEKEFNPFHTDIMEVIFKLEKQ